jgi:hypothetical protein
MHGLGSARRPSIVNVVGMSRSSPRCEGPQSQSPSVNHFVARSRLQMAPKSFKSR